MLDQIRQFKENHYAEWLVALSVMGALVCHLFGKIAEIPLFPCGMVALGWYGIARIREKSKFDSLAFFLGAVAVQLIRWFVMTPADII